MRRAVLTPAQEEFLGSTLDDFDAAVWQAEPAVQAGSERQFIRVFSPLQNEKSYILVVWNSADADWERFLSIARDVSPFTDVLPVVFAADATHGLILEEDLGTVTLKEYCRLHKDTKEVESAYHNVLQRLISWQSPDIKASKTISSRSMDLEMFEWESDYFARHCVMEYFGLEKLLDKTWEEQRKMLARESAKLPKSVMHRDFQSENILIHHGRVRFVDYQGARLGPAEYDLASLLFDPYNESLDEHRVQRLFAYFCAKSPLHITSHSFHLAAMQRLLQALGAFGNLSLHKGKPRYRRFIPVTLYRLKAVINGLGDFGHIGKIVDACLEQLRVTGE